MFMSLFSFCGAFLLHNICERMKLTKKFGNLGFLTPIFLRFYSFRPVIPNVCSAYHIEKIFHALHTTKVFEVVRTPEKLGNYSFRLLKCDYSLLAKTLIVTTC